MSNTLLPCPFCGGEVEIDMLDSENSRNVRIYSAVHCPKCYAWFFKGLSKDKTIAAWNRRAQPENEPLTNAQRIRGMTDEELAVWILRSVDCDKENIMYIPALYKNSDKCDGRCRDGRLSWLQQPAETEGTE